MKVENLITLGNIGNPKKMPKCKNPKKTIVGVFEVDKISRKFVVLLDNNGVCENSKKFNFRKTFSWKISSQTHECFS